MSDLTVAHYGAAEERQWLLLSRFLSEGMDMWVYHTDLKPSLGSRLSIPKAINGSARCSPAWICSDKV
ncbi:uncharacterized [Tachysurus ichikawai]